MRFRVCFTLDWSSGNTFDNPEHVMLIKHHDLLLMSLDWGLLGGANTVTSILYLRTMDPGLRMPSICLVLAVKPCGSVTSGLENGALILLLVTAQPRQRFMGFHNIMLNSQ
jgi:hypothetical protein